MSEIFLNEQTVGQILAVWHLHFIYNYIGLGGTPKSIPPVVKNLQGGNFLLSLAASFYKVNIPFFVKFLFLISKEMKLVSGEVEYSTRLTYPLWVF